MSDNDDPFGVSKRKGKTIVMPNPGGRWSESQSAGPTEPGGSRHSRNSQGTPALPPPQAPPAAAATRGRGTRSMARRWQCSQA